MDDLNLYAVEHDIGYPLLIDYNWQIQSRWALDQTMPSLHLFAPGPTLVVQDVLELDPSEIEALLD